MEKIGTSKKTKEIVQQYDYKIKKHFGQNFLIDQNILENIVKEGKIKENTCVIEVGPGIGSLTEIILKYAKKVVSYEIDKDLIPILENNFKDKDNITFINKDILDVDIDTDIEKYFEDVSDVIFISNLPYYITTPILMKFLETSKYIKRMVCLMQLEVAERICSLQNSKDYNALSLAVQYRSKPRIAFKVPKNVFIPEPNVTSAVVNIEVLENITNKPKNEKTFYELIRKAFTQRRKTLMNNLTTNYKIEKEKFLNMLEELNLNVMIRPENLTLNDYIKLSDKIYEVQNENI